MIKMPKFHNLIIVIPVYNDWESLSILISEIDKAALVGEFYPHLVVIDDGSVEPNDKAHLEENYLNHIKQIDIIHLVRNLGHQKAIALGLAYVNSNSKFDQIVIMDSDGEDRPENIIHFLDENYRLPNTIIFGERTRRSEGLFFRFFYNIYKLGFSFLTGKRISFGNFCIIPAHLLKRIINLPEIWNHFAAPSG
jgi:hypothetical protein